MGCGRWPEKEKQYKPLVKECNEKHKGKYTSHRKCLLEAAKKVGCCKKGGVIKIKTKTLLRDKVRQHNKKYSSKSKKVNEKMLADVFKRGVGAYKTNPSSVRPSVTGPDQWAIARVNVFLKAVRSGKYPSGKFDTDLLPPGHPLKSKRKN